MLGGTAHRCRRANIDLDTAHVVGIDREARHGARVALVAGLADWLDRRPPNEESIRDCNSLLEFGQMHVKNFQVLDMPITGWATACQLEIPQWWKNGWIVRGSEKVKQAPFSNEVASLASWSVGAIWVLAHTRLLKLEPSAVDAEFKARFIS